MRCCVSTLPSTPGCNASDTGRPNAQEVLRTGPTVPQAGQYTHQEDLDHRGRAVVDQLHNLRPGQAVGLGAGRRGHVNK